MKIFDTPKLLLYKKALDVEARQHEAIAQNVANAHRPDYKRVNTDFSEELKTATASRLKKTNERHMDLKPLDKSVESDQEENRVDMNKEMGDLAVNQIRFEFISKALKKVYIGLNSSITGRPS